VGNSDELKLLDELHSRLKGKKALGRKLTPDEKLRHQQLVSMLQVIVLHKQCNSPAPLNSLNVNTLVTTTGCLLTIQNMHVSGSTKLCDKATLQVGNIAVVFCS